MKILIKVLKNIKRRTGFLTRFSRAVLVWNDPRFVGNAVILEAMITTVRMCCTELFHNPTLGIPERCVSGVYIPVSGVRSDVSISKTSGCPKGLKQPITYN